MTAARDRFAAEHRVMEAWLFDIALPLWATRGVDPAGGFYEKIGQDGAPVEEPRRTRVIARQLYCFAAAGRMGWRGDAARLVSHGFAALERACDGAEGLAVATVLPDGTPVDTRYDFYDHAFALFALANAATYAAHRVAALRTAHRLQDAMEARYRHPVAGFCEDRTGTPPLRANPHMHMLEACLALAGVDETPDRWNRVADGIVRLALGRFVDPRTGALREVFDSDWRAWTDAEGQAVEPGHQFEWAWLLSAWNARRTDPAIARCAETLARIGTERGIDAGGRVVDTLDGDLAIRSATARTWPQCERLKCHVEWALAASDDAGAERWWQQAGLALHGWRPFLQTPVAGLWFDRLDRQGAPVDQSAPASTLYHLVCALETARGALNGRDAAATLRLSGAVPAR